MVTRALPRDDAEKAIGALEQAMREGYAYPGVQGQSGAVTRAAALLGLKQSTLHSRIAIAARDYGLEPVRPVTDKAPDFAHNAEKPRIRVPYRTQTTEGRIYKILAIGDHHDKPGRDKTRAKWIGRHAAETSPDYIVSIGDWASLDSLSTHETPGSAGDAARPAFYEDLESLEESLSLFHQEVAVGGLPVFHVHGNHEFRAWRAAERQPKLNGDMPVRVDQVFAQFGWSTSPFGEAITLAGVDFVHCVLNVMGREVGGDNMQLIANKLTRSLVWGHTHVNSVTTARKFLHDDGVGRKITVVNLGTSMPWKVTEKYNRMATTGWGYGLYELRCRDGEILSAKHFDMLELEAAYHD